MDESRLILERLDRIEARLDPLARSFESITELKRDVAPLANHSIHLIIKELEGLESSLQLEDVLEMIRQVLRNVRNITYSLRQLGNLIDFVTTLEPLLKSSVPQLINYLDDIEQKGVFRILEATLGIRAKIAAKYTPEDIDQIGDTLVALLGLLKKMSRPETVHFLEGMVEIPGRVDFALARKVGPIGLLRACSEQGVQEGIGVLIELTKEMGKLRNNNTTEGAGHGKADGPV